VHVAFCNNAPVEKTRRLFVAGEYPEQKLWGAPELERAGYTVSYVDTSDQSPYLHRLSRSLRFRIGELPTEAAVVALADGTPAVDVCYAGCEQTLAGLALLRTLNVFGTPLACVYHNPPKPYTRPIVLGYDLVLALTQKAYDGLLALGRTPEDTVRISWGPQLDWAAYTPTGTSYIISCGKAGRDLATLVAAAGQLSIPTVIYCPENWRAGQANLPSNLSLRPFSAVVPYSDVITDMAGALAVAIPFIHTDRAVALSELADALALGKPVIMTRSEHIDVDIEKLGCGITVEPGDVRRWRLALAQLAREPKLAAEMGERGRAFAEEHWNSRISAEMVRTAIEERFAAPAAARTTAGTSIGSELRDSAHIWEHRLWQRVDRRRVRR
jgi:hypothetical protein